MHFFKSATFGTQKNKDLPKVGMWVEGSDEGRHLFFLVLITAIRGLVHVAVFYTITLIACMISLIFFTITCVIKYCMLFCIKN